MGRTANFGSSNSTEIHYQIPSTPQRLGVLKLSYFSNNQNSPKVQVLPVIDTVNVFQQDFSQQKGQVWIKCSIFNKDTTNNLVIATDPNTSDLITVPPNTLAVITNEIHKYIKATPDAVTGSYELRIELTTTRELQRLGLI